MNVVFFASLTTFTVIIICLFATILMQEKNNAYKESGRMFACFYVCLLLLMISTAFQSTDPSPILKLLVGFSVPAVNLFLVLGFSKRYGVQVSTKMLVGATAIYFIADTFDSSSRGTIAYVFCFISTVFCTYSVLQYDNKNKADVALSIVLICWILFSLFIMLSHQREMHNYYNVEILDILLFLPAYLCGLIVFILSSNLSEMRNTLYIQAMTDSMTGLYNRRFFMEHSKEVLATSKKKKAPVAMIMCDIDKFKAVNDVYGHDVGDKVIVAFAEVIKNNIRKTDVVARIGGEEFVILLANSSIDEANQLAERIREYTQGMLINTLRGEVNFTVSFGVSTCHDSNIDTYLKLADKALYVAKNSGRNRVEVSLR